MNKPAITFEQREQKLDQKMRALEERKRHLRERQRAKEKDELLALEKSLGKVCIGEGIKDAGELLARLRRTQNDSTIPPQMDPQIRQNSGDGGGR